MCKSEKTSLLDYLNYAGILTCNENQYLPCISDIGCGMQDVSDLIDSYDLFYCKAYRKRTTYLSREAYFLLKQCLRIKLYPRVRAMSTGFCRNQWIWRHSSCFLAWT